MSDTFDPYAVLGVARDADDAAITRAYRRELRRCHPDTRSVDAAADERLQQVLAAYSALRDPRRRAAHDRSTSTAVRIPVRFGRR